MTGKEFKKKRLALGLTQHEVSELLGVSRNTVYNYEHDKVIPASRLGFINTVFDKLQKEKLLSNESDGISSLESIFRETESENLLEAVLQKFHPLEVVHHIHKNLEKYTELDEFIMLAKNVVNQQEIETLRKEIETLRIKFENLNEKSNNF
jgi:excisionase family DNA binding protein